MLEKRELIMTRCHSIAATIPSSFNLTIERRVGDPDPLTLDPNQFPYLAVKDDVVFVQDVVNRRETTNLLAGFTFYVNQHQDITPTTLNQMIDDLKERLYTDSDLIDLIDSIRWNSDFKERVPNTYITIVRCQATINYEEQVY